MQIRNLLLGIVTAVFLLSVGACGKSDDKGKGPAERAGAAVDQAVDQAKEQAGQAMGKAGDAIKEAGDKLKDSKK
jgi:predicted small lipoprotein YifL